MAPLTREFVEACPVEGGFRMRGLEMTRVEVFVDAGFVAAVWQLVWIWYTHNKWSRRYGLDDAWTVVFSASLRIVVLAVVVALLVPEALVPWSGFTYLLLGAWFPLMRWVRSRSVPAEGATA
jgi:hypothetical protein